MLLAIVVVWPRPHGILVLPFLLVLVGAVRSDGAPGFYLLADRADPARGDKASGEELQDHDCRIAGAAP